MLGAERIVFRELMRACRRVERAMPSTPAALLVGSTTLRFLSDHAPHALPEAPPEVVLPSAAVRACFRGESVVSLDTGFSALRALGAMSTWIEYSSRLHSQITENAPVEAGALTIAEAIDLLVPNAAEDHRSGATASRQLECDAALDALARSARERLESYPTPASEGGDSSQASRLRVLAAISSTLSREGYIGEIPGVDSLPDVDVASGSSLFRVLQRRRGLPIILCTIFESVAARLGLQLRFTNYPNCILLRMGKLDESGRAAPVDPTSGGYHRAAADATQGPAAEREDCLSFAGAMSELSGLWVADYGWHGPEIIDVAIHRGELLATKLTGDPFVPAGKLSWAAQLSPLAPGREHERMEAEETTDAAEAAGPGGRYSARVQIAEQGFSNPRFETAELEVVRPHEMVLHFTGSVRGTPLTFTRADDGDMWFVDPFRSGRVLPLSFCEEQLRERGAARSDLDRFTAPVEARSVWARMLRNLRLWDERRGNSERAHIWRCIAYGLEPDEFDLDWSKSVGST
jgi:regulator of sirC expression with transglutaminase-like and TPR domain